MTIQSAISGALPFLRAEAEARMISRVNVRRKTGDTTEVDGYEVDEWVTVHGNLPFQLGASSNGDGGARAITIGGVTFEQATNVGKMPADTTDLRDDDYLELVAGEWSGSVYRIVEATKKDQATARRIPIVEAVRPEEWS